VTGIVLKVVGLALAALVVGLIGIMVFTDVWAQVGIGAAIVVICAPLLIWAWSMDRKEKARRQGLEDI
jgi:membrane protein implicated in regulation of membrane protease activity